MKKELLVITAAATGVLIYLLLRRNFGNPHRSIRLKTKPDVDTILNYKFAN